MLRLFFHYYASLLPYNLTMSLICGAVGANVLGGGFVSSFLFFFFTAGHGFALWQYHRMHKNTYFFYYNRGFSFPMLAGFSAGLNLVISIIVLVTVKTVGQFQTI